MRASPQRRLIDAFLAGETGAAAGLLADDAVFRSPIRDYHGAPRIAEVWRAVDGVLTAARPTRFHRYGRESAAFFTGVIAERPVDGVVRAVADEHGRVADVTLMVRPLAALRAGLADVRI